MISNVVEWCSDYYQADYYYVSPDVDPEGPANGTDRVIRGAAVFVHSLGSWMRATWRGGVPPLTTSHGYGFRCAQTAP